MATILTTTNNLTTLKNYTAASDANRAWPITLESVHRMNRVLRVAKARGCSVWENPDPEFGGGVHDGWHSKDGMHYAVIWCSICDRWHGGAGDINYSTTGPKEQRMLDPLAAYAILSGVRTLWGEGVAGHSDHAHLDTTPVRRSEVRFANPELLSWPGEKYPVTFSRTLKRGSANVEVRHLQQHLNTLGYGVAVDGQFGANTEKAVRNFQRAQGLSVDGYAGPATLTKVVYRTCQKIMAG